MAKNRYSKREPEEEADKYLRRKTKKTEQLQLADTTIPSDEYNIPDFDLTVIASPDKQVELLQNIHSDTQRDNLITQLQQSYGNIYTRHIIERIEEKKGTAQPLNRKTGFEMEKTLGHTIPDIRIHTDTEANLLSRELGADAFTAGKDIYFSEGAYQPDSENGRELLDHELVHGMQQDMSGNEIVDKGDPDIEPIKREALAEEPVQLGSFQNSAVAKIHRKKQRNPEPFFHQVKNRQGRLSRHL